MRLTRRETDYIRERLDETLTSEDKEGQKSKEKYNEVLNEIYVKGDYRLSVTNKITLYNFIETIKDIIEEEV